jgi:predicted nucleotide-binding protein
VGFAIILLSADDIGYSKKDGEKSAKERARQNVVFELGFFTAKLGRKRVVALVEKSETFDLPSDIHGVIYIQFDGSDGKWKFEVAKELLESGYKLNTNKII